MPMTIAYEVGKSLYLNITNRCSNRCGFCVRARTDGVGSGDNLWLDQEPTVEQVLITLREKDLTQYQELVFCGFGEPMYRVPEIIQICQSVKAYANIPIRINTNGQANLITGQNIPPLLSDLVDTVSISLNTPDRDSYQEICQSIYGTEAFDALLDFAAKCKKHVKQVIFTVVDILSPQDIKTCRDLAEKIGINFRVRHFVS